MRETERRIKEYQQRLPHLKEKVAAVAIMLIMSVVMMTSATFAWLVLSKSPEVTGIDTTVAANGNLEIALVDKDGEAPDASEVGDSGKDVVVKNVTWGNLVNLSDPSYGLEKITLRPATLNINSTNLLNNPLRAAAYGNDGRVTKLSGDFIYTNYNKDADKFVMPENMQYGVRAVSAFKYGSLTGDTDYMQSMEAVEIAMGQAESTYTTLVENKDGNNPYIKVISGMIGDYLTAQFGGNGDFECTKYMSSLYDMLLMFKSSMDSVGESLVYMANTQVLINTGKLGNYTFETLMASTPQQLKEKGIELTTFEGYKKDYNLLVSHTATIADLTDDTKVMWSQIKTVVNFIVEINSCIVRGQGFEYRVDQIGKSVATQILGKGPYYAVITNGAMKNLEQRIGNKLDTKATIKATYIVTIPIDAESITTSAKAPFSLNEDMLKTQKMYEATGGEIVGSDAVATDIYAMAMDLWVRTNADGSSLILEGEADVQEIQETDKDGNLIFVDEDGQEYVKKGNTYYHRTTDQEIPDVSSLNLSPMYKKVITGYNGENRIWEEGAYGGDSSTTQGTGSCYIFYADTPQDVQQGLELLKSMRIAFIDENGKLLTQAIMNTDMAFQEPGRVTVPVELMTSSPIAGEDEFGNKIYSIMPMTAGEAARITVLVYLNGEGLYNDEVLAASDIQGQLNIQFGSSAQLSHAEDEDLFDDEITLSATAAKTMFDFETDKNANNEITTKVTVTVGGKVADTVGVNFVRAINSTQGSRLERVNLTSNEDGTWSNNVSFRAPGTYMLRTVWVDGVEYRLHEPLVITVTGFAVDSVSWDYIDSNGYAYVMTSDAVSETNIRVSFGSDSMVPNKAQGVFEGDDNKSVTVDLKPGTGGVWSGDARFITSGTYTLKYIIADNQYYEVPVSQQKVLEAYLGVRGQVWLSENNFVYTEPKTLDVSLVIEDDQGQQMTNLLGVELSYRLGSSVGVNAVDSDMVWNAASGRYEGKFLIAKAGSYSFNKITVGDNSVITGVLAAPIIRAIPPEPPQYHGNTTKEYQFAPNSDAVFSVSLTNADTATIKGIFAKSSRLHEIDGVLSSTVGNVSTFVFTLPKENQEGDWQLTELKIQDIYYEGTYLEGDNWLTWDMTSENIVSDVVTNVVVNVSGNSTVYDSYLLDSSNVVSGTTVTISDSKGRALPEIADVNLTYLFVDGSNTNYTASTFDNAKANPSTTMTLKEGSQTVYVADKDLQFIYGGKYGGKLTFTLAGKTYTYAHGSLDSGSVGTTNYTIFKTGQAPEYEVKWKTPVVKFNAVDPTNAIDTDQGSKTNSLSDFAITVYYKKVSSTSCNVTTTNYYPSAANVILSEAGTNFTSATCTIVNDNPADGDYENVTFNMSPSKLTSDMVDIGNTKDSNGTKYPMKTGSKATIVDVTGTDGVVYSFTLANPLTVTSPC